MDDKFDNFSDGSRLRLYLDVQTDSGYTMKTELFRISAEDDFRPKAMNGILEIFDPSGKSAVRTSEDIKQ